ncbi:MAG: TPM domain-containing protein [Muribaculaceae bacterium]|nr:TPM domain-containing protein [Muribaculaceae bacterium]
MNIKQIAILFLYAIIALTATAYTVDEVPNVHVRDVRQFVSDPDNILNSTTRDSLNSMISDIWTRSKAELVVVIIKNMDGSDVDSFATDLFRKWGIGKKDANNGVLILVSTEDRQAAIRTGTGTEAILPDIICSRIYHDTMKPFFKDENYDKGLIAAVNQIHGLLTTPGAIDELKSKYENDEREENRNIFVVVITLLAGIALIITISVVAAIAKKDNDQYSRYHRLEKQRTMCIVGAFFTLGMALPALVILLLAMHHCRNKRRICSNCKAKMIKLSEKDDNQYLTPSQDLEEQLNSVDYDVWKCATCGNIEIYPFISRTTNFVECNACHAKTAILTSNRVVMQPGPGKQGKGIKTYKCRNCGATYEIAYTIAALAAAAPVIIGGIGGSHRGGGGGFGGGSFGGGTTMGGGASGSW